MRQTYQQPLLTVIDVEAEQPIAVSLGTTDDKADPNIGVLSNERRDERSWGDLWED